MRLRSVSLTKARSSGLLKRATSYTLSFVSRSGQSDYSTSSTTLSNTNASPPSRSQISRISRTIPIVDFPNHYKFNRELQKGSDGYVEQWSHIPTKTLVAVKVIKYPASSNENLILRDLPYHNSIVTYLGYYEKQLGPDKASILLECCLQGDLFTVRSLAVKRNKHLFSEGYMWSLFSQLVGALAFL
jgi:hypothetical protein